MDLLRHMRIPRRLRRRIRHWLPTLVFGVFLPALFVLAVAYVASHGS